MKIGVNVEKRYLIILLLGIGIFIVGGFVIAYGTSNPSTFGHSLGEIEGVPASGIQAKITNGLTQCAGANLSIKTINSITGN